MSGLFIIGKGVNIFREGLALDDLPFWVMRFYLAGDYCLFFVGRHPQSIANISGLTS